MSRLKLKVRVPNDGKLVVQLPSEYADQEVDVEIDIVAIPANKPTNATSQFLAELATWRATRTHGQLRSKSDIDEQVQRERDSWD
jgi:hypothetical protein